MPIILERFAYHFIDKTANKIKCSPSEKNIKSLDSTIVEFFVSLTTEMRDAEDSGNTVSGHFNIGVNSSKACPLIQEILANPNSLFPNSVKLAELLYQVSPSNASRGILTVLLCSDTESKTKFVAIYKIKCEDDRIIKMLSGDELPELAVEEVRDILFKELQKGGLIPHPDRKQFDLKVTDLQSTSFEPSKYFGATFLGCTTKKSDEYQIKKLIPELVRFGSSNGISVKEENIPTVITKLGEVKGSVTIPIIEEVIEAEKLYGDGYLRDTFTTFVEKSQNINQFDVDSKKLMNKKSGETRRLTYTIRDPELNGIVISGPSGVMKKIRTTVGDTVVFRIEVVKANVETKYE